jgi:hypothetical protein
MWNDREWLWVAGKLYVYDDDGKIVLYSKVKGAGWLRPFKNRRSSGTGSLAGGCSSGAGSCSGGSCGPGRGLFGRRR